MQSILNYLDHWSWRIWQRIEELQNELQEAQRELNKIKAAKLKGTLKKPAAAKPFILALATLFTDVASTVPIFSDEMKL